jgi:TolB protein
MNNHERSAVLIALLTPSARGWSDRIITRISAEAVPRLRPFLICALAAILMFVPGASAQGVHLDVPVIKSAGRVEITARGTGAGWLRLDSSSNLVTWSPQALATNSTGTLTFADTNGGQYPHNFYTALPVDPVLQITRVWPARAIAGEHVTIEGQFFKEGKPGAQRVLFGGVEGTVLEASATRLVVEVPEGVRSGKVQVSTGSEVAESPEAFTALATVESRISPPSGMSAADFTPFNLIGHADDGKLLIRRDLPLLNMAVPSDSNSPAVLFSFSTSDAQPISFTVESTAEALVFMHPALWSLDFQQAERVLGAAATNQAVSALANIIGTAYSAGREPEQEPGYAAAYSNAVVSIFNDGRVRALGLKTRETARLKAASVSGSGDYPIDMEYIELGTADANNRSYGKLKREIRKGQSNDYPYFTAVDWLVEIWKLDADRAFPNGRLDFERTWKEGLRWPEDATGPEFPKASTTPLEKKFVDAQAFNKITSPIKTAVAWVFDQVRGPRDNSTSFPDEDAIYVLRAFGPDSFDALGESTFTLNNYPFEHIHIRALNLVNAALQLAGAFFDAAGFEADGEPVVPQITKYKFASYKDKLISKMVSDAVTKVPKIQSASDVLSAAAGLVETLLQQLAAKASEIGIKEGADYAAREGLTRLATAADGANAVLKTLDLSGTSTQLGLRAYSWFKTTPLETAYIVIGEPFTLSVVSVNPAVAAPGDDVTITFKGSTNVMKFGTAQGDSLSLEGPDVIDPEVVTVSGPGTDGVQALTFRLPASLPGSADGDYTIYVTASGRKAKAGLHISDQPYISSISPTEGFAPSSSFLGAPFTGSFVEVKGVSFGTKDRFYFRGAGAGALIPVPATNIFGLSGDVTLEVPDGAVSGPIRVVHVRSDGVEQATESLPFEVLGPPEIVDVLPYHGPRGTAVTVYVHNGGPSSATISASFTGTAPAKATYNSSILKVAVPLAAQTGPTQLIVETPAGTSSANFKVEEGTSNGGAIEVGGSSPITLARACLFAAGPTVPEDDEDYTKNAQGQITKYLDPPNEEGDYVTDNHNDSVPRFPVGAEFQDTINLSGDVSGDAELTSSNDNIVGGSYHGTLTVSGDGNNLRNMRVQGTIIVTGNNNQLYDITFANGPGDALIIRGSNNVSTLCNFLTNKGDGIRIESGKFNHIEAGDSVLNGGNGVTLTDGAAYNEVFIGTGRFGRGSAITPGTGNLGHGIALIGSASNNVVTTYDGGSSGNGKDGLHLEGRGVTGNRLNCTQMSVNGGNGISIIDIGELNTFPNSIIRCDSNTVHGAAIYNSSNLVFTLNAWANGGNGLLLSNVFGKNDSSSIQFRSVRGSTDIGNGKAALRLENGTRGVHVTVTGELRGDGGGVELIGPDCANNLIQNISVTGAPADGILLDRAAGNILECNVKGSTGNGIALRGASRNFIRIDGSDGNTLAGVLLTDGASNNVISALRGTTFWGFLGTNGTGCVIEKGANANIISELTINKSVGNGLVLRDQGTDRNHISLVTVSSSGQDGVLVSDGASNNELGTMETPDPAVPFRFSLTDNNGAGIHVTGNGTTNNLITLAGFTQGTHQNTGVLIDGAASGTVIATNAFYSSAQAILIRDGAHHISLRANLIQQPPGAGILVTNAHDVFIGGPKPEDANHIEQQTTGIQLAGSSTSGCIIQDNSLQKNTDGVVISDSAHNNVIGPGNNIEQNSNGIRIADSILNWIYSNQIDRNTLAGILIENNSAGTFVSQNIINNNAEGVRISGVLSIRNSVIQNFITGNAGKGIALVSSGNGEIEPPSLTEFLGDTLYGTADVPDGSLVEIFKDDADEGQIPLAETLVNNGQFSSPLQLNPAEVVVFYNINATVTDRDGNTSEFSGSFHPDLPLAKVVFASNRDGNWEIYMIDPPMAGAQRLTSNSADDTEPALSADGRKVLFTSTRDGNKEIYVMEAEAGAMPQRLTTEPGADYAAHWGNSNIYFTSERDGSPAIYVMGLDGSNQHRVIAGTGSQLGGSLSPDGSQVAYSSPAGPGGKSQIFVANADGSNAKNVSNSNANDTEPAWSPSGKTIAFVSDRSGNPDIFTMNSAGGNVARLTTSDAVDQQPGWVPGGSQLFFSSNRGGTYAIYIIEASGGTALRYDIADGDSTQPSAGAP